MKKIFIEIFDFFIVILRIIKSILRGPCYHFDKKKRNKILIIGNGPSYREFDFSKIDSDFDLMCVNLFPLKEKLFWKIKPRYLCIIDPGFLKRLKDIDGYMECLENVTWKMDIICPQGRTIIIKNNNISFIKLNMIYYGSPIMKCFFYKHNMANFGMHNVIHGALFASINLNYQEIYLTGTDYSEIKNVRINSDNDFVILSEHGYEKNEFINLTKNGNYKKGEFYWFFYYNYKGLKSFVEANEYAEHRGSKIYNLVPNSYIDAFEKIEW